MKESIGNFVQRHHLDVENKQEQSAALQSKDWAALEKLHTDGWKPVSRFLNEAELKYSINGLEIVAVVCAETYYPYYLF